MSDCYIEKNNGMWIIYIDGKPAAKSASFCRMSKLYTKYKKTVREKILLYIFENKLSIFTKKEIRVGLSLSRFDDNFLNTWEQMKDCKYFTFDFNINKWRFNV